jgi:hypothetical protein
LKKQRHVRKLRMRRFPKIVLRMETTRLTAARVPRMAEEEGQETVVSEAVMDQPHGRRSLLSDMLLRESFEVEISCTPS